MTKILVLVIALFSLGLSAKENCNDIDYVYWPISIDSTQLYIERTIDYYTKVDSITNEIHKLEAQLPSTKWRIYFDIYQYYKSLEKLSIGEHPKRKDYYRRMKEIYHKFSVDLRRFNFRKRVTKKIFKYEIPDNSSNVQENNISRNNLNE